MKASIRILLADQQIITIEGLRGILSREEDMLILDHALTKNKLWEKLETHNPDVLISDFNTIEFLTLEDLKRISTSFKTTQVLLITSEVDRDNLNKAKELGVKGFITKKCSLDEILLATRTVANGQRFICPSILDILFNEPESSQDDDINLTPREIEILKLIALGKSTISIASDLFVSPHTVQTHRKNIIKKLQIKSPTQFVIHAMDRGLI